MAGTWQRCLWCSAPVLTKEGNTNVFANEMLRISRFMGRRPALIHWTPPPPIRGFRVCTMPACQHVVLQPRKELSTGWPICGGLQ